MTYKTFDIVIVPFPFVDSNVTKVRPALILSSHKSNEQGSIILAMITSAQHNKKWNDVLISDLSVAGLSVASIIRMKVFTLDASSVYKKIGVLDMQSQVEFKKTFKHSFNDLFKI